MMSTEHAYMKAQIENSLRLKETDELLEIWQQADHEAWTDLAFEVVQEILLERLGQIPAPPAGELEPGTPETSPQPTAQVPAASDEDIRKFLRKQTYDAMDEMETGTLLEIWHAADRVEWTDLAFDVVRQILWERIGAVPNPEPGQQPLQQAEDVPAPAVLQAAQSDDDGQQLDESSFNFITMHCPDCGKAISERDLNCPHCGVDLEAPLSEGELQSLAAGYAIKAQHNYDLGHDFKAALADCDLALEYTPDAARLHNLRGLILDALGKTGLAVLEYKIALQLEPGLSEASDNLADAEAELKAIKTA